MDVQYVGEHLLAGRLGNALVILAFFSALLATFSFYLASGKSSLHGRWKRLGRSAFYLHSFSVAAIIALLLWMLIQRYFEFYFIWQHSSNDMPRRYVFAALWEGQEGSFLLWAFWHVVIGCLLIWRSGVWEMPVMAVMSSVQMFIMSMLLGWQLFGWKMGSNPFNMLLREHPDFISAPIFSDPSYLSKIDGRGMNPLLQNYWMTIHPPTLFLGFALTLVPFSYAIAGLWKKRFTEWVRPALPWTFAGVMILGAGILMGGAWAYEALSFGGFWAWDPVENASLVPWLILAGAGHLMLLNKKKNVSSFTLYLLTLTSFILVLYSTFLTRSGILGDASVHAFTDMGMSGQLLIYLLFYVILSLVMLLLNLRKIPRHEKEEAVMSREFWMVIAGLVLLISSFQITFTTSIPLINKIFGTDLAPPSNPIEHYNAWQIPFAVIVCLLIGFVQFLKYQHTDIRIFIRKMATSTGLAVVASILLSVIGGFNNPFHIALFFASIFAVAGNADYFVRVIKGRVKHAGSSIAHIGMGLILLGALVSNSKRKIISQNSSGVDISALDTAIHNSENILLFQGDTLPMGDYLVSYRGKSKEGVNMHYLVDYSVKREDGSIQQAFTLKPRVQLNPRFGNVAEPDTRHFWSYDIYTHVTYGKTETDENDPEHYNDPVTDTMHVGDTLATASALIVLNGLNSNIDNAAYQLRESDLALGFNFTIYDSAMSAHRVIAVFAMRDTTQPVVVAADAAEAGIKLAVTNILPEESAYVVSYVEKKKAGREFIIMKAIIFPWINILWLGSILLFLGTAISIYRRIVR